MIQRSACLAQKLTTLLSRGVVGAVSGGHVRRRPLGPRRIPEDQRQGQPEIFYLPFAQQLSKMTAAQAEEARAALSLGESLADKIQNKPAPAAKPAAAPAREEEPREEKRPRVSAALEV